MFQRIFQTGCAAAQIIQAIIIGAIEAVHHIMEAIHTIIRAIIM
jgi:hypothetical protein